MQPDYTALMEPVARHLLGEPNERLSKPAELRFGTHGSLSVDLERGTFYDHEASQGGGVLDLVMLKTDSARTRHEAAKWLEDRGLCTWSENLISEDLDKKEKDTEKNAKVRRAENGGSQVHEVHQVHGNEPPPAPGPALGTASNPPPAGQPLGPVVARYDYRDEAGALVLQVLRHDPKTFRQRRPEGSGWSWSVKGVRPLPYRLPELLAAPDAPVYVVEGEKDAGALAALGLVATCNAGGAGKWKAEHAQHLHGRRVVVLPDNDEAGAKHADVVRRSLRNIATSVAVVNLPGLPEKGDVSDWLAAGGTLAELERLSAAPADQDAGQNPAATEGRRSQADLMIEHIRRHFHLLHDTNGETYAQDVTTGELRRIGGRQFSDRAKAGFYAAHGRGARAQAWAEARDTIQAIARFEGQPQAVHVRVAGGAGVYYVDLCQPGNSRAVQIDAQGWRIMEAPPVLFVRSDAMQPLPDPAHGGSLGPLWSIANIPAPCARWPWRGCWTVCAPIPHTPAWSWWARWAAAKAPPPPPCAA